jgi:hypothetical protein
VRCNNTWPPFNSASAYAFLDAGWTNACRSVSRKDALPATIFADSGNEPLCTLLYARAMNVGVHLGGDNSLFRL